MTLALSVTALLATMACGVCFAGFDAARKWAGASVTPGPMLIWIFVGHLPVFAVLAIIDGWPVVTSAYWLPMAGAVLVGFVSNVMFLESLRRAALSETIPLLSITPVTTSLAGYLFLGEALSAGQGLGIAFVMLGILVLYRGPGQGFGAALRRLATETGALLMAGVALLWSILPVFDKLAVAESSIPAHVLIALSFLLPMLLAWTLLKGESPLPPKGTALLATLLAAFVGAASLAFQLWAITLAPVGLVEALKRVIGQTAAVASGRLFFGEPWTANKTMAIVLMALGVPLVILG
ncbi:MAG: EamA family transporter [Rhodospirillales bacterium]